MSFSEYHSTLTELAQQQTRELLEQQMLFPLKGTNTACCNLGMSSHNFYNLYFVWQNNHRICKVPQALRKSIIPEDTTKVTIYQLNHCHAHCQAISSWWTLHLLSHGILLWAIFKRTTVDRRESWMKKTTQTLDSIAWNGVEQIASVK